MGHILRLVEGRRNLRYNNIMNIMAGGSLVTVEKRKLRNFCIFITLFIPFIIPVLHPIYMHSEMYQFDYGFPFQFITVYGDTSSNWLFSKLFSGNEGVAINPLSAFVNFLVFYYLFVLYYKVKNRYFHPNLIYNK